MKQLLFLLLFPCLALAQYPGNGNQKISLGEQTTADGLIYRGLAADTTRKPSVDTMAYILLDTNTNIIWQYKKATNNAWTRVGGSISSGVTGVLPVANGGTGSGTQNFVDLTTDQSASGVKTFPNKIIVGGSTGVSLLANPAANGFGGFWHNSVTPNIINYAMQTNGGTTLINASTAVTIAQGGSGKISARSYGADVVGSFGINQNPPTEELHVVGDGLFSGNIGIGSATPTTSGTGITFPATQSASTNVNTLDDYEEGTWTTTFGLKNNLTGTPVLSEAKYRKIGQLVYIEGTVTGLSLTSTNTETYIQMTVPINMNTNTTSQVGNAYTFTSSLGISGVISDWSGSDKTDLGIIIPAPLITSTGSLIKLLFSITYISEN